MTLRSPFLLVILKVSWPVGATAKHPLAVAQKGSGYALLPCLWGGGTAYCTALPWRRVHLGISLWGSSVATAGPSLCPACHYVFPCDYIIQPSDGMKSLWGVISSQSRFCQFLEQTHSETTHIVHFRVSSGGKCPFEDCFLSAKDLLCSQSQNKSRYTMKLPPLESQCHHTPAWLVFN